MVKSKFSFEFKQMSNEVKLNVSKFSVGKDKKQISNGDLLYLFIFLLELNVNLSQTYNRN